MPTPARARAGWPCAPATPARAGTAGSSAAPPTSPDRSSATSRPPRWWAGTTATGSTPPSSGAGQHRRQRRPREHLHHRQRLRQRRHRLGRRQHHPRRHGRQQPDRHQRPPDLRRERRADAGLDLHQRQRFRHHRAGRWPRRRHHRLHRRHHQDLSQRPEERLPGQQRSRAESALSHRRQRPRGCGPGRHTHHPGPDRRDQGQRDGGRRRRRCASPWKAPMPASCWPPPTPARAGIICTRWTPASTPRDSWRSATARMR